MTTESEWVEAHMPIARDEVRRQSSRLRAIGVEYADAVQECAIRLVVAHRSDAPEKGGALARITARHTVESIARPKRPRAEFSRPRLGLRSIPGLYLDGPVPGVEDGSTYAASLVDNEPGAHMMESAPRDRVAERLRVLDAERVILGAGLNDEQMRVIVLVLLGWTCTEIAEAHGVSRQSVHQQTNRIIARIARNAGPQERERAA